MACNPDTENKCDACYNFDDSVIAARAINDSAEDTNCQTLLPDLLKVENCKRYSGTDTLSQTSQKLETCSICNTDFLNFEYNSGDSTNGTASCSNTAISSDCNKIDHCLTTICKRESETSSTYKSYCYYCKKNYYNYVVKGLEACVLGGIIDSCAYYTSNTGSRLCYICDKNYAVNPDGLSCKSFSADPNCRQLNSNDECHYCWHSYYWANNGCTMFSNLIKTSMTLNTVILSMVFFTIN